MFHKERVWGVGPVASAEETAEKLTRHTRTLCTGFSPSGYLFSNDSTGEDGAQEYGVVKCPPSPGDPYRQVESITFGWCDYAQGLEYVRQILAGTFDDCGVAVSGLRTETPTDHGRCCLCM